MPWRLCTAVAGPGARSAGSTRGIMADAALPGVVAPWLPVAAAAAEPLRAAVRCRVLPAADVGCPPGLGPGGGSGDSMPARPARVRPKAARRGEGSMGLRRAGRDVPGLSRLARLPGRPAAVAWMGWKQVSQRSIRPAGRGGVDWPCSAHGTCGRHQRFCFGDIWLTGALRCGQWALQQGGIQRRRQQASAASAAAAPRGTLLRGAALCALWPQVWQLQGLQPTRLHQLLLLHGLADCCWHLECCDV